MPTPTLILVEGMTGAGKSTTAENLEVWLRAGGTPVRRGRLRPRPVGLPDWSRYLQNSVQPRYLSGAPVAKVHEGFRKIRDQVAFAEPLLVYLRPQDIREHLRRCLDERETKWATWLVETFGGYAWARSRGITGEEAVFAFYEDWEAVAAELFEAHPGPKLRLSDPLEDWDAALARIHAARSV